MAQIPPIVLSFAASDPSGGAGLQADILTISSLGCHPLSVLTAITVQDTIGVHAIQALDHQWVDAQARSVLADSEVAVLKCGLLGSVHIIATIAQIARDYPHLPLLIDPVLNSGRGDELSTQTMIEAMREQLFPLATLITPNSVEARRLVCADDVSVSLDDCALRLLAMGCKQVLITGTHEASSMVRNTLYRQDWQASLEWNLLDGNFHGSGCTLTSAIAACMAQGLAIEEAVSTAQDYTWRALEKGYNIGKGQSIPDRLFWAREAHV